jgi:2-polyprenyl-6-methoxyphenol hydroxylase-like FAD-dependent oxidoreductase
MPNYKDGTRKLLILTLVSFISTVYTILPGSISMKIPKCEKILIVGGGPVGLSTAVMFSKRGYKDITVIERASKDHFDSERAYQYLLDGRGQKLTNLLGITNSVVMEAVSSKLFQNITIFELSGELKVRPVPVDPNTIEKYWLPRSALMKVLKKEVDKCSDTVNVIYNTKCVNVNIIEDFVNTSSNENSLTPIPTTPVDIDVQVSNLIDGKITHFSPDLVIGCDGINSGKQNIINIYDILIYTINIYK